jgi:hypothetical protein
MEDRICISVEGFMWAGPLWQQHFIAQPFDAITPAADRLPPRIMTMAVQTAFNMIDFVPVRFLFIVSYYTKYHIVLSIKMIKNFEPLEKGEKII